MHSESGRIGISPILREVLRVESEIIRRGDALLESLTRRTGEGKGEGLKLGKKK